MSILVVGFANRSVPVQIERARNIVIELTGNAVFTAPNPALITITDAINALEIAYNESRNRDKVKMALMRVKQRELLALINTLGAYVANESAGDETKILSSGFSVKKQPEPLGPVTAPLDLRVDEGTAEQSLLMRWKPVKGGVAYVVEICKDPLDANQFEPAGVTTKLRFQATNLVSGGKYWTRVAAIGKEGLGPYSDPAVKRVA